MVQGNGVNRTAGVSVSGLGFSLGSLCHAA